MAHHGRPREEFSPGPAAGGTNISWEKHVRHWQPRDGYDPAAEAMRLIDQVRARWPEAWDGGEALPNAPRFVALFAGLLVLADWIGSDGTLFPVGAPYGAERDAIRDERARVAVAARGLTPLVTPAATFERASRSRHVAYRTRRRPTILARSR